MVKSWLAWFCLFQTVRGVEAAPNPLSRRCWPRGPWVCVLPVLLQLETAQSTPAQHQPAPFTVSVSHRAHPAVSWAGSEGKRSPSKYSFGATLKIISATAVPPFCEPVVWKQLHWGWARHTQPHCVAIGTETSLCPSNSQVLTSELLKGRISIQWTELTKIAILSLCLSQQFPTVDFLFLSPAMVCNLGLC